MVVTFHSATLVSRQVLPFTWAGLSPAGSRQLCLAHRYDLPVLICVLNDGAYGAEIHKLRADKLDDSGSMFGRRLLAGIAKGFGLQGATITSLDQIVGLLEEFKANKEPTLWDFHISDQVVSPMMRRGVMRPR